jgi:hypothetical protein
MSGECQISFDDKFKPQKYLGHPYARIAIPWRPADHYCPSLAGIFDIE